MHISRVILIILHHLPELLFPQGYRELIRVKLTKFLADSMVFTSGTTGMLSGGLLMGIVVIISPSL